jgi:mycofactocin precursor
LALSAITLRPISSEIPGEPFAQEKIMEYVNPNLENADVEVADLVIEDLVEDVSIDGMCGVY